MQETAPAPVGGWEKGEEERESQADPQLSTEPGMGLDLDPELTSGAKVESQMLDRLSHPDAPQNVYYVACSTPKITGQVQKHV